MKVQAQEARLLRLGSVTLTPQPQGWEALLSLGLAVVATTTMRAPLSTSTITSTSMTMTSLAQRPLQVQVPLVLQVLHGSILTQGAIPNLPNNNSPTSTCQSPSRGSQQLRLKTAPHSGLNNRNSVQRLQGHNNNPSVDQISSVIPSLRLLGNPRHLPPPESHLQGNLSLSLRDVLLHLLTTLHLLLQGVGTLPETNPQDANPRNLKDGHHPHQNP